MKIFAIIVTYNAMHRSWIEQCLKSIEASTTPMTAIVIDNGSTDETRSFVPLRFPNAVWLPQEKNLGFGQANNVGLRYALEHEADYVLLLNQDATIAPDAIEKMVPLCNDYTLLSPLHLNGDATSLDKSFKKCIAASNDSLLDDMLVGKKLKSAYSGPELSSGCVIPAACWFISRHIIEMIGGFNPLFFHYSEDDNYFRRLHFHKITIKFCPQATMCHDRQEHGNMQLFNRQIVRRQCLLVATDINLTFWKRLPWWMRIFKNAPAQFISSLPWLIAHYGKIRQSRKAEKNTGRTWL